VFLLGGKELSRGTIEEISAILEAEGFDRSKPVRIKDLRKPGKWSIVGKLQRIALKNGFKDDVTNLILAAGWKSWYITATEECLVAALKKFYPLEDCIEACTGKKDLAGISAFKNKNSMVMWAYEKKFERKKWPSIKDAINRLYPELLEFLPESITLYDIISKVTRVRDVDIESLEKDLKSIYTDRGDISPTGLKNYGQIYKKVGVVACHPEKFRSGSTRTQVISNLTGIKPEEFIKSTQKKAKDIGDLAEDLTRLFFLLMKDVHKMPAELAEIFHEPILKVTGSRGARVYLDGTDKYFMPDIILLSEETAAAVEVKRYGQNYNCKVDKIIRQLGHKGDLFYRSGGKNVKIGKRFAFIHGPNGNSEEVADKLSKNKIKAFTSAEFEKGLEFVLENTSASLPCSPEQISDMYRTVAYYPHMIIGKSQIAKLGYAKWFLKTLNKSLIGGIPFEMHPVSVFGHKGSDRKNKRGTFQLFKIPLSKLEKTQTIEYVRKNLSVLGERLCLFFDLETCGLSRHSPVISSGFAYKTKGDFVVEIAFARSPWEEGALLYHINEQIPEFSIVVTYNGKSFDIPVIKRRSNAHIILAETIPKHVDVYNNAIKPFKNRLGLKTANLKEIDVMLGNARIDIPGRKVPQRYNEYLYGGTDVSPILEHNALDMISLAAAYIFAKKELDIKF